MHEQATKTETIEKYIQGRCVHVRTCTHLSSFVHDAYPYSVPWGGCGSWNMEPMALAQRGVAAEAGLTTTTGGRGCSFGGSTERTKYNNIGTNNDVGNYRTVHIHGDLPTYLPTYLRYPGTVHIHGDLPTYLPTYLRYPGTVHIHGDLPTYLLTLSRNSAYPW